MPTIHPRAERALSARAQLLLNEPGALIGELVLPTVQTDATELEVGSYQARYWKHDVRTAFGSADSTDPDKWVRAPGADAREDVLYTMSQATFTLEERSRAFTIPRSNQRVDGIDMRAGWLAAEMERHRLMLERQAANTIFTATNYTSSHRITLASGSRLDDSGVNPRDLFVQWQDMIAQATGRRGNVLVCGRTVGRKLMSGMNGNLEGVGVDERRVYDLDVLARALGFDAIYVGNAVYNSANEGQAASLTDVWTATSLAVLHIPRVFLGRANPANPLPPDRATLAAFAYRFVPQGVPRIRVESWYEPRKRSDVYMLSDISAPQVVGDSFGVHVTTAVNA